MPTRYKFSEGKVHVLDDEIVQMPERDVEAGKTVVYFKVKPIKMFGGHRQVRDSPKTATLSQSGTKRNRLT